LICHPTTPLTRTDEEGGGGGGGNNYFLTLVKYIQPPILD